MAFATVGALGVAASAVAIVAGPPAGAVAQVAPAVREQPAAVAAQQPASPAGGPGDGIKVHGHWTITVVNPDGTIAEAREFENALQPDGGSALADLLARNISVGKWAVFVDSTGLTKPCSVSNGVDAACAIAEPGFFLPPKAEDFETLTIGLFSPCVSCAPSLKLALQGSATAANTSNIDLVETDLSRCAPTTAASSPCAGGTRGIAGQTSRDTLIFTSKALSPGIPVAPGQQIQVTVVISFS